ncbi:MAG: CrcB family protein [Planctomycetaceae bacterium]|jgi:CrcB protein|nr:CrcB family protein [Planctomycetaceae bacterium]
MTARLVLLLAFAGTFGVLLRFVIIRALAFGNGSFPWGTVAVNLLGCFLYGLLFVIMYERFQVSRDDVIYVAVLTGFLGALTTFSSYAFDLYGFIVQKAWLNMSGYVLLQNFGGLGMLLVGMRLGRVLF